MEKANVFINYMSKHMQQVPSVSIDDLIKQAGGLDHVYLVFVDILKGFCEMGALSSARVNEMVQPSAQLAEALQKKGLSSDHVIFLNDHHPQDAKEFSTFPPHCVRETDEAEVVHPLQTFAQQPGVNIFHKNATSGMFGVNADGIRFHEWLEQVFTKETPLFLMIGDCTDLCIYQNAMGIQLLANEKNADVQIIIPQSHVRTYDIPVEQAEQLGIMAHDADLLDLVFLYHMKLNGIQVVPEVKLTVD
ncbi:isochorismatase family protein [Hazenella coriacea]|uniref:Nicotinamidase-related amidase n=1 Tax=Hazenella coriacea TaxID=1179467 RepID=A0A4R3L4Y1_9BACL|nr:isochorismatase family protein [Hazenella coriacea]TCS94733.1 nicotinamidase-related amidase [Hazenella coriacea]